MHPDLGRPRRRGDQARAAGGRSSAHARRPVALGRHASKFLAFNRNKRSIAVDLKAPEGREILAKLVTRADVLVANIRPAALERIGLTYEHCARLNPRLIYCSLVGFGQNGQYRAKPAYDTIIQGASGVAACHARATGEPRYVPM